MAEQQFDLVVVGAGSGGLAAAKRAAGHGAKVAIVEDSRVGGTCVIRGCIPKKLMVYASHLGALSHYARDFGWTFDNLTLSWSHLVKMRNDVVDRLEGIHEGNLEKANVTLVRGRGVFEDPHRLRAGDEMLTAERFLIATGARPVMPAFTGSDHTVSSDGLFELDHRPESVLLVGGGYIAVEYAGILQGLGCQTTLVVRSELLRGFDRDLGRALEDDLKREGVHVLRPAQVTGLKVDGDQRHAIVDVAGEEQVVDVETCVITAIGRKPNTDGIGLENIGVKTGSKGEIVVDEHHQTSVEHIFAVGDVIDRANLTPVAIKAGRTFADRVYANKDVTMSYEAIPSAVFSQPPVATVGFTEDEARARFGEDVQVFTSSYAPLMYSATPPERKVRSMLKMVVQRSTDRVLGCHMVGDDAPEIIQGFAVGVRMGATKAQFDQTVAIHPTQAEEFVLMT